MGLTGRVETTKYAGGGRSHIEYPRNPVRYSKMEVAEMREPPGLGEDSNWVLREILGYN